MIDSCPWKEYKSDSGRPYFHNTETKESKWTIPDELQKLKGNLLILKKLLSSIHISDLLRSFIFEIQHCLNEKKKIDAFFIFFFFLVVVDLKTMAFDHSFMQWIHRAYQIHSHKYLIQYSLPCFTFIDFLDPGFTRWGP